MARVFNLKHFHMGLFINYITQLGDGGGWRKHYARAKGIAALRRGGGIISPKWFQQYHVVLFRISPLGSDWGWGQQASWAVHGIGAWVVHGVGAWDFWGFAYLYHLEQYQFLTQINKIKSVIFLRTISL